MHALPEPYATHLPPLLAAAYAEDLPDLTGVAVFGPRDRTTALLVAKKPGVLCGIPAFAAAFTFLDPTCQVDIERGEGTSARAGETVAVISGPSRAILAAERTALNFATRLSGVATMTRQFVDGLQGTRCRVLDTRKTTPGWRALEKHAVRCGGGVNHRKGLFDVAMLKDTHLAACGSITAGVAKVRERWGEAVPLVVECTTLAMVEEALACKVEHVMLDNMPVATVRKAVELVAGRSILEASGGVNLDNALSIAETGVDFISVGALTHSAPALDLSLQVRP